MKTFILKHTRNQKEISIRVYPSDVIAQDTMEREFWKAMPPWMNNNDPNIRIDEHTAQIVSGTTVETWCIQPC